MFKSSLIFNKFYFTSCPLLWTIVLVSLGAILLSLYYIFLWKNPHTRNYMLRKAEVRVMG